MKRKIIVFDLDDTLYKEIDFLKSAYREIASWVEETYRKHNVYDFMFSCYKQNFDVFACVNNRFEIEVPLEVYLNKYRMHIPTISLSENVKNTLKYMHGKGYVLGIITDGRSITQENKIHVLKLNQYIIWENCIISETFGYSKPSLEAYVYFQHKYEYSDFYYVGDNVTKDFIAPNKLGWTSICLKDDGRNIHKQILVSEEMKPQYKITSFCELIRIIERN